MKRQYFIDIFKAMGVREDMFDTPAFSDFLQTLESCYQYYSFGKTYYGDERPHFSKVDSGYELIIPNSKGIDSKMTVSVSDFSPVISFTARGNGSQLGFDPAIPDILECQKLRANMEGDGFSYSLDYANSFEGGKHCYTSYCGGMQRHFDQFGVELERNYITSPTAQQPLPPRSMTSNVLMRTMDYYRQNPYFKPFFGCGTEVQVRRLYVDVVEKSVTEGNKPTQYSCHLIDGDDGYRTLNLKSEGDIRELSDLEVGLLLEKENDLTKFGLAPYRKGRDHFSYYPEKENNVKVA